MHKLNVKKNKNGLYSFAFVEFTNGHDATRAIEKLDQYELFGKRMKVYVLFDLDGRTSQARDAFTAKDLDITLGNVLRIEDRQGQVKEEKE